PVLRTRVEPEVRPEPPEDRRVCDDEPHRVVRREPLEVRAVDRADLGRLHVAGPALDDGELVRMPEGDVHGPEAAFGEAADRATGPRRDRAVVRVDPADEVARD